MKCPLATKISTMPIPNIGDRPNFHFRHLLFFLYLFTLMFYRLFSHDVENPIWPSHGVATAIRNLEFIHFQKAESS